VLANGLSGNTYAFVLEKKVHLANRHLLCRFSILWGIHMAGRNISILLLMYNHYDCAKGRILIMGAHFENFMISSG
jgi:hypothetical protein